MRILRITTLMLAVVFLLYFSFATDTDESVSMQHNDAAEKSLYVKRKPSPGQFVKKHSLEGELFNWIGRTEEELLHEFGEPDRKDLSAYQYVWWVYTNQRDYHIQFGVEDGMVQTIYAIGENVPVDFLQAGKSYQAIQEVFNFNEEVSYTDGFAYFTFRMTQEDILRRPLVKITDDIFIQFYFDTFTDELSSIRIMDAEVLLRHQPYEVVYRGSLPPKPTLSDEEWSQVEEGMEQQIFDMSNVIRHRFGKTPLEWEEHVSEVAYLHSKDMNDNNYFSHYSLNGDGLKERLTDTGVFYVSAGENIAAQYPDAPSAVEGWLNSEGHREALLADEYTHLGVGVYRFYYTQNFLAKPM